MPEPTKGFLSGKKTYLVAIGSLVAGFVAFGIGEPFCGFDFETFGDFVRFSVEPILAMTLRHGIAKS